MSYFLPDAARRTREGSFSTTVSDIKDWSRYLNSMYHVYPCYIAKGVYITILLYYIQCCLALVPLVLWHLLIYALYITTTAMGNQTSSWESGEIHRVER